MHSLFNVVLLLVGGLFFGWNALSIMIKDLGNYSEGCEDASVPSTEGDGECTACACRIILVLLHEECNFILCNYSGSIPSY